MELVIAPRNNGGSVCPSSAMTCCKTDPPPDRICYFYLQPKQGGDDVPADSPHIVTFVGSPPNFEI